MYHQPGLEWLYETFISTAKERFKEKFGRSPKLYDVSYQRRFHTSLLIYIHHNIKKARISVRAL